MNRSRTILFLTETDYYNGSLMLSGLREEASHAGYRVVTYCLESMMNPYQFDDKERQIQDITKLFPVDAVLFMGWAKIAVDIPRLRELLSSLGEVPFISIGALRPGVPSIHVDGYSLLIKILNHLYDDHGCRSIGFIGPLRPDDRNQAWLDWTKSKGIYDPKLIISDGDLPGPQSDFHHRSTLALEELLDKRKTKPDALVSCFAHESFYLAHYLKGRGYRIPEDIRLISWEDSPWTTMSAPPITSMVYPWFELGAEAARVVTHSLRSNEAMPLSRVVVPSILFKESCGCTSKDHQVQSQGSILSNILEKEEDNTLLDLSRELLTTLRHDELFRLVEKTTRNLRIPWAAIYLWNETLGKNRLELVFAFHQDHGRLSLKHMSDSDLYIYTKETPKWWGNEDCVLVPLSVRNHILGLAVFAQGPAKERTFKSLGIQFSTALETLSTLGRLEDARRVLSNQAMELEEANGKLRSLDLLKNDFIANIAHDFRSPLTIILNNADLGRRGNSKQEIQPTLDRFGTIYSASLRLKSSIDRLLDLTRMDVQGVKLRVKKLMPVQMLQEIGDFYRKGLLDCNITLTADLGMEEISDFYSDADKIEEIISNLISNAVKFVDKEEGAITLGLRVVTGGIEIYVEDNGQGISAQDMAILFNRFSQGQAGKNSTHRGSGIGLAYSRQLAGYLRGSLRAESPGPGLGSRFTLSLPLGTVGIKDEDWDEDGPDQGTGTSQKTEKYRLVEWELERRSENQEVVVEMPSPNAPGEFTVKKGLILIVEDQRAIREIVKEYLVLAGFCNFIIAPNGQLGIDAAFRYRPDIIISDFNMPGLRGDQLQDEFSANPDFKSVPFLFLSAMTDRAVIIERRKKGAVAFISKPVDETDLILNVENHLQKYMEFRSIIYQSSLDELTGLNNRRTILKNLANLVTGRMWSPLTLIFFDLDHFKLLNDRWGHPAGDDVLRTVGRVLQKTLRPYDLAGRYGGEEFIVALPGTNLQGGRAAAQKISEALKHEVFEFEGNHVSVSGSFGVASLQDHASEIEARLGITNLEGLYTGAERTPEEWDDANRNKGLVADILLKLADLALYWAKETHCRTCGFHSGKEQDFGKDACSSCGSVDLERGRDRVVYFNQWNQD